MKNENVKQLNPWVAVIAVALGYFVDLYDLFVFSATRLRGLKELGIPDNLSAHFATSLMNWTVLGMVIGGFLWGIIADKKGRMTVLFLSIITYSIATGLNAFVQDIFYFKVLRFIAGIGIAGELGLGITLVSELLPKEKRTIATAVISSMGMLGAVTAGLMANFTEGLVLFNMSGWRYSFLLGSIIGFCLLIFRLNIRESELFKKTIILTKGDSIFSLLKDKKRFLRYIYCTLAGLPVFFIIGILLSLSKELAENKGVIGIKPSNALIYAYLCIAFFDIIGNILSKILKSRKKILYGFIIFQAIASAIYLYVPAYSQSDFYIRCGLLGASIGLGWAVLVTNAAEQFGTNFRATVTTSVPNLIRGLLVPLTIFLYEPLIKLGLSKIDSAGLVILFCVLISLFAISRLEDRFENSVDFLETNKTDIK